MFIEDSDFIGSGRTVEISFALDGKSFDELSKKEYWKELCAFITENEQEKRPHCVTSIATSEDESSRKLRGVKDIAMSVLIAVVSWIATKQVDEIFGASLLLVLVALYINSK